MKLLRVWTENIPLIKQLCKDQEIRVTVGKGFTDSDGDKFHSVDIHGQLNIDSWGHYQKHRIRK